MWLIPSPNSSDSSNGSDSPVTAHYCRACPPTGPITDLTCLHCGEGPLLAGALAPDLDNALPPASRDWLTTAGWRLDGPVCPGCRPRH